MPTAESAIFPATAAQERIWIVEQLTPGTAAYHIPLVLKLRGTLDLPALRTSLRQVADRHEALRTSISQIDGQPVQVVRPAVVPPLEETDMTGAAPDGISLRHAIEREISLPFDIAAGPLIRARLFRLAGEDHLLAITVHHLIADMWSCGILLEDLAACYTQEVTGRPARLADLPVQYPDFAVWERDRMTRPWLDELLAYWRDRLAGAPQSLELPTGRPRPPVQSLRGHQVQVSLGAELSEQVRELARTQGSTPFMILLGAFQVLLGRYAGQDDIVISTGTAVRTPETEKLVGCFINTVLLRTSMAGGPTFAELLGRVREITLSALDHQELPFDRLVADLQPDRDLSRNPLAQVMFILQNTPVRTPELPGLTVAFEPADRGGAQCDLNVQLRDENGQYTGFVEYAEDLFDAGTVGSMWACYQTLLAAAAADPGLPVHDLPWLSRLEAERAVRDWNLTAAPVTEHCLHELFEQRAAATPAAPALAWPGGEMDYGTLNRRADLIAARLRRLGVGPEVLVAICLERSAEFAAAVLGILKAGGAYVPLETGYPAERLAFMLADAQPEVLLTSGELLGSLPVDEASGTVEGTGRPPRPRVIDIGDLLAGEADEADATAKPGERAGPGNLAYVIYTSGSTGQPKGIAVTHRGAANNIADLNRREAVGPGDRILALSASGFDMSVYELLGLLAAGGTVILPDPQRARDPRHWADLIDSDQVTVWNSAPPLLEALVGSYGSERHPASPSLRAAFLGGDSIPVDLAGRARALFPGLSVHALGGATEASIHSIDYPVGEVGADWRHLPYGRPMANQQALIVDRQLRPVPPDVPGELCLAGIGLSRGYLRRPALTAERFVPHPYAGAFPHIPAGARMYRTGDLCRYAPDGTIHLIGRMDQQVKLRGFRIEPGEIEDALRRHPAVADAVVVARRDDADRGVGLVAYLVAAPEEQLPDPGTLRAHLRQRLPEYMVPEAFVPLDALPLSANGKVDRRALPSPGPLRREVAGEYVPPSTPLEQAIADMWLSVLQIDRVGADDDFFELGGNSLGVTQVAAAIADNLRVDLPLSAVFESPTVTGQARAVEAAAELPGTDVGAIAELYLQVIILTEEQAEELLAETEEVS